MTNLNCSVRSCTNNKAEQCCRPIITVGGKNAQMCSQTRCENYRQLKDRSPDETPAMNNIGVDYEYPNKSLRVSCMAKNCVFNKNELCSADKISIKGDAGGTECASFRNK